MASQTIVTITHDKEATVDLKNQFLEVNGQPRFQATKLENLLGKLAGGAAMGTLVASVDDGDGVQASGTVTFSSLANNDTVTIGGIVFVAKTSGASGALQFNLGANDTAAAVNFAAAVNAHASLVRVVTASPAAAVTTIACTHKGLIGNYVTLAISAHGSVSAATLASGTNSANRASYTFAFGV